MKPELAAITRILMILLQYAVLILLYLVIFKLAKAVRSDIKNAQAPQANTTALTQNSEVNPRGWLHVIHAEHEKSLQDARFSLMQTTTIGRSSSNDIVISSSYMSSEHACISYYDNHYWITDLNSTNGTLYNGEKLTKRDQRLTAGDIIRFGNIVMRFER